LGRKAKINGKEKEGNKASEQHREGDRETCSTID